MSDTVRAGWVVYILECGDGSLYTGITNNLERRIAAHNNGTAARYTRGRLPVVLRYTEPQTSRATASRREHEIKSMTRGEKEKLLAG
jgi:putative endonuclease